MLVLTVLWIFVQVIIGYNLLVPGFFYVVWRISARENAAVPFGQAESDYAIIVTAYEQTTMLKSVVKSILNLNYRNYIVYIVADNCDIEGLDFNSDQVILLRPPEVLSSNTKSHFYAIDHFIRDHQRITIIDSDNLLDKEYLNALNNSFSYSFEAVQGLRAAKNLETTIACLDAARDLYYHFYDGKLLFEIGSSATLSGSGMAFDKNLYHRFLHENSVSGAGFDKVLQAWLVAQNKRIAFNELAVVYDEKTTKTEQLVHQRSRWINTWFKYMRLGFGILGRGIQQGSKNQLLFGLVLLRPPLFIFLLASILFLLIDLLLAAWISSIIWLVALVSFVFFFWISLSHSHADGRIYRSLKGIPKFIFFQLISLAKAGKANKISVATKHYYEEGSKDEN